MIVNNEDYYYLPGVAKAIKTILGRDDLKKDDVPEVLAALNYDYDTNTIPYQTHGKTISLYRKASIPELLDVPGNRYKAIQIVSKIVARQKGINVFNTQPILGRSRPNRKNNVTVREAVKIRKYSPILENYDISKDVLRHEPDSIEKVYVNKHDRSNFLVYGGYYWYNICGKDMVLALGDDQFYDSQNIVRSLNISYDRENIDARIEAQQGKISIYVDGRRDTKKDKVEIWMNKKGYYKDSYSSDDTVVVYRIKNVIPSKRVNAQLEDYEDFTSEYLACNVTLSPIKILENIKAIYNHIVNVDTVYKAGEKTLNMSYVPSGIHILGAMRDDFPTDNTSLLGFAIENSFADQFISGFGFVEGTYKFNCKGIPSTMIVKRAPSSIYKYAAYIFYDNDASLRYNRTCESYIHSINESQESDSQKMAIKLIMSEWGWNKEKADNFVRKDLRGLFLNLGHNSKLGKFTVGLVRLLVDGLDESSDVVQDLNDVLPELLNHYDEYNKNLNGLSAEDLIIALSPNKQKVIENEKRILGEINFQGGSEYDIVKINSYEEAQQYEKFTPVKSSWCLTNDFTRWQYHSGYGRYDVYFCLKKGFQNIKETAGTNCPFDEYGLSMICVAVNRKGELITSALRWNHLHGCNDKMLNAVQLSKVLNVNFYEYFSRDDKTTNKLSILQTRLNDGEKIDDVFKYVIECNGVYICTCDDYSQILVDGNNKIITGYSYANILPYHDVFIAINDDCDDYKILDVGGNVLVQDCDYCDDTWASNKGLICLRKSGTSKYNYFDIFNKRFISDMWYDRVRYIDGTIEGFVGDKKYCMFGGKMKEVSNESYVTYRRCLNDLIL